MDRCSNCGSSAQVRVTFENKNGKGYKIITCGCGNREEIEMDTLKNPTVADKTVFETSRLYVYKEYNLSKTWYFVGVKGEKCYLFCSQSKEACIKEAKHYENFKSLVI